MAKITGVAALAAAGFAAAGAAWGQAPAAINIDPAAGYEQSLICYQFHGVNMQIADAMKKRAGLAENQVAQYEAVSKRSKYLQQKWFIHLGDVNGEKDVKAMNADLQRVAGGIISDANAGLGGDAAAQARNTAVRDGCTPFEKMEGGEAAPAVPTAPAPG